MSVEYHLYRIKFIKPAQIPLFLSEITPAEIFMKALNEKPSYEVNEGLIWHIGNLQFSSENFGKFAIGRTTKTTVEKYDDHLKNFKEVDDDRSPYTYVLFDISLGLIGIATKNTLASTSKAISNKIKDTLSKSNIVSDYEVDVRVDHVPNPVNFIERLKKAFVVKKFKATFTGPNPVDADELFQKPLSVYCNEMKAENGSIEVSGESLDSNVVQLVAKATAATGNSASARIKESEFGDVITIRLKAEPVRLFIDDNTEIEEAVKLLRSHYAEVRT
ncbi:hypothetical protein [Aliivibrio fischeri]|uniref:hypothetical protein n=1 Tax=Aliivibrio fischeri TaxID=668 RepID=UPI000312F3FA|nr:hypothetical protein [Aliivibrio fischeri]OEE11607.1 hypothetical protein A1Q3_18480 [Aliivibrio fischeri ZF-211]